MNTSRFTRHVRFFLKETNILSSLSLRLQPLLLSSVLERIQRHLWVCIWKKNPPELCHNCQMHLLKSMRSFYLQLRLCHHPVTEKAPKSWKRIIFLMGRRGVEIKGFGLYSTPGIFFPRLGKEQAGGLGGRLLTVLTARIREGGNISWKPTELWTFFHACQRAPCKAW